MLTCRDIAGEVTDHEEHKLSRGQRLKYWMHLAMCSVCRRYVRQMRLTSAVLCETRREVSPLDDSLRNAFRGSRDQRSEQ